MDFSELERLGIAVQTEVPLASLTSIKVGGPAQFFVAVTSTGQLLKSVRWARQQELPYLVLGGGSNVLISDLGVRGLVIHNRCRALRIDRPPCCESPRDERPYLWAESGAAMAGVARYSVQHGLAGLEWAVSVPGTVGGAVVNNSGAHGGEVKDSLISALLVDENGDVDEYGVEDFHYSYRHSVLKKPAAASPSPRFSLRQPLQAGFGPVVLSANFRLPYGDPTEARQRADAFLHHRRRTQPVEASLGSTFVNPPGDYAGRLIEAAGLKGCRVGGIEVSSLHANFLINPGGVGSATAADVLALIESIQVRVLQESGVELVPEIQLLGEWQAVLQKTGEGP